MWANIRVGSAKFQLYGFLQGKHYLTQNYAQLKRVESGRRLKRDKKLAQKDTNSAKQNLESLTQEMRESTILLAESTRTLAQERRTLADQNALLEFMENQLTSTYSCNNQKDGSMNDDQYNKWFADGIL
ncbi:hypothetical protein ACFE04_029827 [Oxalis oulophora]